MNRRQPATVPFAGVLTVALLERLAGDRSYARGAAYFRDGAVQNLVQTRDALAARVLGTEEYRVVLRPAGRSLSWSCICPVSGGRGLKPSSASHNARRAP